MAQYTPNLGLYKPNRLDSEEVDVTLSENFTKIDTHLADMVTVNLKNKGAVKGEDASPVLQNAINQIVSSGVKGKILIPFDIKLNSKITLNLDFVSLEGNGITIDTSGILTGEAILVIGTNNPPYDKNLNIIKGIKLSGNKATGTIGIKYDTPSGGETAQIVLEQVNVVNYDIGEQYLNNAYLIRHINYNSYNCNINIDIPNGGMNYGENLLYVGCALFNSDLIVRNNQESCGVTFLGCSLDYVDQYFDNIGKINCIGCHIENRAHTSIQFVNRSFGSTNITDSWMIFHDFPHANYLASVETGSFFTVTNTFMTGTMNTFDTMASGNGLVVLRDIKGYNSYTNNTKISDNTNSLIDGGFEGSSILDNISLTADSQPITNRFTGDCLQLTLSTAEKNSGTKSLAINKTWGAGTAGAFSLFVPVQYGQWFDCSYYHKAVGMTGEVKVNFYLANVTFKENGLHTVNKKDKVTDKNFFTDANSTFVKETMPAKVLCNKGLYNCVIVEFDLNFVAGNNGDLYIDDLFVNTY